MIAEHSAENWKKKQTDLVEKGWSSRASSLKGRLNERFVFFSWRRLEGWWYKQTKESKLYLTSLSRSAATCRSILNFQTASKLSGVFFLLLLPLLPSTKPATPEEKHCFWNNCNIYFSFSPSQIIETEKNAQSDSVISGTCQARQHSITKKTHLYCLFVFSDGLMGKRSNFKVPHYAKFLLTEVFQKQHLKPNSQGKNEK